ncbi:DNA-binding response regulator MtrA [bacterium HR34]|nr:DNA-binding response regulator MtrA [bacterium HR34]
MTEEKYKILLVEDDKFLADIYTTKFTHEGFDVLNVGDGAMVLEKAKVYKPDLVMLDLVLPNMDGWEVFEALRNDEETKNLKVVVFSNLDSQEDYEKAKKFSAIGYIVKAKNTPKDVVEKIKELINK